jgi:hypothetical protein
MLNIFGSRFDSNCFNCVYKEILCYRLHNQEDLKYIDLLTCEIRIQFLLVKCLKDRKVPTVNSA